MSWSLIICWIVFSGKNKNNYQVLIHAVGFPNFFSISDNYELDKLDTQHKVPGYRERWVGQKGKGGQQKTVDRDQVKSRNIEIYICKRHNGHYHRPIRKMVGKAENHPQQDCNQKNKQKSQETPQAHKLALCENKVSNRRSAHRAASMLKKEPFTSQLTHGCQGRSYSQTSQAEEEDLAFFLNLQAPKASPLQWARKLVVTWSPLHRYRST